MEKIYFDKTEIVFVDTYGDSNQHYNLRCDEITSVLFDRKTISKFFGLKKIDTRVIMIKPASIDKQLELHEYREKDFERYMDGMRKFCKDNHITLRSNID